MEEWYGARITADRFGGFLEPDMGRDEPMALVIHDHILPDYVQKSRISQYTLRFCKFESTEYSFACASLTI